MENHIISVAIGIVSSLLATGLFIGLSEFVRRIVLPWYENRIYRGVRIDGEWSLTEIGGISFEDEEMKMSLSQHGDRVSGSYYHVDGGNKFEYVVSGRISGMYFLATAVPKTSRQIDAISFLLHIDTNSGYLEMSGGVLNQGQPGEVKVNDGCKFKWGP